MYSGVTQRNEINAQSFGIRIPWVNTETQRMAQISMCGISWDYTPWRPTNQPVGILRGLTLLGLLGELLLEVVKEVGVEVLSLVSK